MQHGKQVAGRFAQVACGREVACPFALAEVGMYDYRRFVAGGSAKVGPGDLLVVGQAKFYDGPWDLAEDFDGYSGFVKYSVPLGMGRLQATLNVFDASWAPTEQIPERAIGTLVPDAFGTLDPTLRGSNDRHILTLGYQSNDLRLTAYLQN